MQKRLGTTGLVTTTTAVAAQRTEVTIETAAHGKLVYDPIYCAVVIVLKDNEASKRQASICTYGNFHLSSNSSFGYRIFI